jgi:hypothetical protein
MKWETADNATPLKNKIEKLEIKEGVDFIFGNNPELEKIGTKDQYSKYLNTIFPESKVKDIVYHGTAADFESFEKKPTNHNNDELTGQFGHYFTRNIKSADIYREVSSKTLSDEQPTAELVKHYYHGKAGKIFCAKVDFQNPKIYNTYLDFRDDLELNGSNILNGEHDSIISLSDSSGSDELVGLNPNQIHLLGTRDDLESFKKFIS